MDNNLAKAGVTVGIAVGVAAVIGAGGAIYHFVFKKDQLKTLVDPNVKVPLMLIDKYDISPDTKRFRFALPSDDHVLGLPLGNHAYMCARHDGELLVRPYTPISTPDSKGYVDFVIKIYNPNDKFPKGGKFTQYLDSLTPGENGVDFKGPSGKITYTGPGCLSILADKKKAPLKIKMKKLNLICGGTGLTPMFQLIQEIRNNPNDSTDISIVYANNSVPDILLKDELEQLQSKGKGEMKIWYTVIDAPANWRYSKGFITKEMLQNNLYAPSDDQVVLMCGPPPMINLACVPNLEALGYDKALTFTF